MTRYRLIAAAVFAATLISCGDEQQVTIADPVTATAVARVKFFHFGVNAPQVNFYGNTAKLTAISSATGVESTTGVAYGAAGNSGLYSTVAPASYTLTGKIAATVDKDLAIASVTQNLDAGKAYSFFMSGFYSTGTKTVEAFVVEDPFVETIDFTVAYVRFVHAISNAAPLTLYAKNTTSLVETAVGAQIAYKSAGAFTSFAPGTYDLGARLAGVSTNAVSRTGVSFVAGRTYTIGARGDITVVSTTATNRPFLDQTANK